MSRRETWTLEYLHAREQVLGGTFWRQGALVVNRDPVIALERLRVALGGRAAARGWLLDVLELDGMELEDAS